jgi:hypothetical protein
VFLQLVYAYLSAARNNGLFGVNFHEASIDLLNVQYLQFVLQIRVLLKLIPGRGGDGTVDGIIAMNDTGSDMLMLFTTDLTRLENTQGYTGWHAPREVMDANSTTSIFPALTIEV